MGNTIDLAFQFRGNPMTLWYYHVTHGVLYNVNDIHRTVIAAVSMDRTVRIKVMGLTDHEITLDGIMRDGAPVRAVSAAKGVDVYLEIDGLRCGDRPYSHVCFTAIARPTNGTSATLIGDPLVILVPKREACQ